LVSVGRKENAPVEHHCSPGRWAEFGLLYIFYLQYAPVRTDRSP
jgi:hypothetical protein